MANPFKKRGIQTYGEVCRVVTERGASPGAARKRIVECRPRTKEAKVPHDFSPSCHNKSCACGVSYEDFRGGWSYRDAHEMVGGRGKGGTEPTYAPSQRKVVRMLAKLKRDEWKRHQDACKVGTSFDDDADFDVASLGDDFSGVKGKA